MGSKKVPWRILMMCLHSKYSSRVIFNLSESYFSPSLQQNIVLPCLRYVSGYFLHSKSFYCVEVLFNDLPKKDILNKHESGLASFFFAQASPFSYPLRVFGQEREGTRTSRVPNLLLCTVSILPRTSLVLCSQSFWHLSNGSTEHHTYAKAKNV